MAKLYVYFLFFFGVENIVKIIYFGLFRNKFIARLLFSNMEIMCGVVVFFFFCIVISLLYMRAYVCVY